MKNRNGFSELFLLIVFFIAMVTLFGCSTQTVVVKKEVALLPDDNLLTTCAVSPPPTSEYYFSLTHEQRAEEMFSLAKSQYLDMSKCNARWKLLQQWKQQQLELHKEAKP